MEDRPVLDFTVGDDSEVVASAVDDKFEIGDLGLTQAHWGPLVDIVGLGVEY